MTQRAWERELKKIKLEDEFAAARERASFEIRLAEILLKSATLINGGAIVALFTFLGNSADKTLGFTIHGDRLWGGFAAFSLGLTLAVAATLVAYLSQHFSSRAKYIYPFNVFQRETGGVESDQQPLLSAKAQRYRNWAVTACAVSLMAFLLGSLLTLWAVLPPFVASGLR